MKCNILPQDINQKLDGCVFNYKNKPYKVVYAGGNYLQLYSLDEGQQGPKILYNDDDLDIASLPLGYVNTNKMKVYYLVRHPYRKWKQGVNSVNVKVYDTKGNPVTVNSSSLVYSKYYENSLLNEFPSTEEALETLRSKIGGLFSTPDNEVYEIAVSRDIALSINTIGIVTVFYKNKNIGWVQPNKNTVHVPTSEYSGVISKYLSSVFDWQKID